jgi:hypothetical protein
MRDSKWIHAALAFSLLACSQEPGSESAIEGEAAPTLHGTVSAVAVDEAVDVLVLWSFYPGLLDEEPPTLLPAERVQIEGSFPSDFTLGAIEPPPNFVLEGGVVATRDPGGARVAEGYIVAVRAGTSIDSLEFTDIVGTDRVHSIAYVESDIESGSFGEYFLGPLAAGFHLIEKQPLTRDCDSDPDTEAWHENADGTGVCSERVFAPAAQGFATTLAIEGLWSTTNASGETVAVPYLELW